MSTKQLTGDYILLSVEELQLLVPQSEASTVAHLEDKSSASPRWIADNKALQHYIDEEKIAFTALSSSLQILPELPNKRFVIITLNSAPTIRWCWSDVQLLNNISLTTTDIPQLLKTPRTPVTAVATLKDGSQAFVCTADNLLGYALQ